MESKKKIIKIILSCFLSFCFQSKAQTIITDSLESKVIQYFKKNNENLSKETILFASFYLTSTEYIILIEKYKYKPCKSEISKSGIYKVLVLDEKRKLYFANVFLKNMTIDKDTAPFFLSDTEYNAIEKKSRLQSKFPEMTMLLVNREFSIIEKSKGTNIPNLMEDLLCPTAPGSIKRVKLREEQKRP